jgi:hypothetical protein
MPTIEEQRDGLYKRLVDRRPDVTRLFRYYRGDHPLPWADDKIRDAYLALMKIARANWCRLIVQAPAERLRVLGLRFSEEPRGDEPSDTDVWRRMWQGNRMDLQSRMIHNAALVARRSFVLVWPRTGRAPRMTAEHPSQVIVDYAPGDPTVRVAALKAFTDANAGREFCVMWTPDEVRHWWRPWTALTGDTARLVSLGGGTLHGDWRPWDDPAAGITAAAGNPVGEVPVIEYQAHPEMVDEPMGELDGGVTEVQDRINKTVLDRLVTSNFASFRQRWATGLEIPKDDQGNDIEPFQTAVNRLWIAEDSEARFGEFSVSDLKNYLDSVEADVQHLAATTRTPPHYLLGQQGAFPSGDSLKATETGLVAKTLEIRDSFTESHEDAARLWLRINGDPRADDDALSMLWQNPESRSDAELHDAATKKMAVGVPWRSIMEYLGYSPQEIERMDAERAEDAATAALAAPAPMLALPPGRPPAAAPPALPRPAEVLA